MPSATIISLPPDTKCSRRKKNYNQLQSNICSCQTKIDRALNFIIEAVKFIVYKFTRLLSRLRLEKQVFGIENQK